MDVALRVRESAAKRILFLPHAIRQMAHPDRMITSAEARHTIEVRSVIEDYPDDPRGHSCLMLGEGLDGRAIHVVCAPRDDYLAIITAYLPSASEWEADHRTRKHR